MNAVRFKNNHKKEKLTSNDINRLKKHIKEENLKNYIIDHDKFLRAH